MRLGIDIDGTIQDTQRTAVKVYNRVFGADIKYEDIKEFYLDKAYDILPQHAKAVWSKLEEKIYSIGKPFKGASDVLNDLVKEGHEILFITARPEHKNVPKITREWLLNYNFPYNGKNLYIGATEKGVISSDLSIDLFFDDDPKHLNNLVKSDIDIVVMDAPYNQSYPKKFSRMKDWKEVYKFLK